LIPLALAAAIEAARAIFAASTDSVACAARRAISPAGNLGTFMAWWSLAVVDGCGGNVVWGF